MTIVWSLDSFNPVKRNDSDNCWRSWLPCDPIRMLPCIKIWAARWIRPQKVTSVNWSRRPIRDCPVALLLLNVCLGFLGVGSFFATVSGLTLQNPIYFSTPSSESLCIAAVAAWRPRVPCRYQFPHTVGLEGPSPLSIGDLLRAAKP